MKPEEKARKQIDKMLELSDWIVQDLKEINLGVSSGVAVRDFPLKYGAADYLLMEWLNLIKDHIIASYSITIEDFALTLFHSKGGPVKAQKIFGKEFNTIINELNEVLAA